MDPLAINSSDLDSANIEFVVEEDSGNQSVVTFDNLNEVLGNRNVNTSDCSSEDLNEKVTGEDIILYVEGDEENRTNQNDDSFHDESTDSNIEDLEGMIVEEIDTTNNVETMIIDDDDASNNSNSQNENSVQQNIKSTVTSFKSRSEKNSFNESFVSFVGKTIEKKVHYESLESSQEKEISKKNVPENKTADKVSPIPSILKKKLTDAELPKNKSLMNPSVSKSKTVKSTKKGESVLKPLTLATPSSSPLVYILGPNNALALAQPAPAVAPINLAAMPHGMQGVLPVGVLPAPVIEAMSQQKSQNTTLVLMPTTAPQGSNIPTPVPPFIITKPPWSTSSQNMPIPLLLNSNLPIISDVRSIDSKTIKENGNSRKINILSKSKTVNTNSKKLNNASTETVSMMVDGEEIIVTTPTNFKSPSKPNTFSTVLKTTESKRQLFEITDLQSKSKSNDNIVKITQANLCYVPNCTIQKGEKVYLFGVPVDKTLMHLWDSSINRPDKRLQNNDIVCEKHFAEEDIVFIKETRTEGTTNSTKAKPKLKKGAIPCMVYHENCCVPNCTQQNEKTKMVRFPIFNPSVMELWLQLLKNPNLKKLTPYELLKHRVCSVHFEQDCFDKNGELIKTAAPTRYLPESDSSTDLLKINSVNATSRTGVNLKCLFSNCDQDKNVFMFPSDFQKCNQWLEACNRQDLICSNHAETGRLLRVLKAGICRDHFNEDEFEGPFKLTADAIPKSKKRSLAQASSTLQKPTNNVPNESIDLTCSESPVDSETESLGNYVGCVYLNCSFIRETIDIQLFPFPENPRSRFRLWLEACGYRNVGTVESNNKLKVCSKHFTSVMFTKINGQTILKAHAIPIFSFDSVDINEKSKKNKLFNKTKRCSEEIEVLAEEVVHCSVRSCLQIYAKSSYKGMQHTFPDPETEQDRFSLWLKLIGNDVLASETPNDIATTYVVCERHFEGFFYTDGKKKAGPLASVAVPTLNLPKDIKWFFGTDFYKNDVKDYLKQKISVGENVIQWLPYDVIDKSESKNICVLEKDRLNFPGIGYHLYMDKIDSSNKKRKYPYDVYRYRNSSSSYSLMEDIEFGESLQIHTAIIINDDDEMERKVLQELLDKRKKKRTEIIASTPLNTAT